MYRLKELDVWRVSRELSHLTYHLTMRDPLEKHFKLRDQIRSAAASVPANIAEGYGLGTRPQFIRGLRISRGSVYELQAHLELANEVGLIESARHHDVQALLTRTIALINGMLRSLQR